MRIVVGATCMSASFFAAGCASIEAPSDRAPHFEKSDAAAGVSVAVTSDGCTASVLFDDAAVSGPQPRNWEREIPLKVAGGDSGIAVSGSASGYYSGAGKVTASLGVSGMTTVRIFDFNGAMEGNWTSDFQAPGRYIPGAGFSVLIELRGDAETYDLDGNTVWTKLAPADAKLTVDSVDLVIPDCGKRAS